MNIYEIAELANVSIATVSKVINAKHDISNETREKVLKIIKENNYKPKVSTVNMQNIAIFAPIGKITPISNPYFSTILSGVGDVAYDHDFSISIVSTNRIPRNAHDFLKYCHQRKIDGAIFVLLSLEDNYIVNFAHKLPIVAVSGHYKNYPIGVVMADNHSGGYLAVKHLLDYGHENIMFIVPSMNYNDHVMRVEGGEKALQELNLVKHSNSIDNTLLLSDMDLGYYLRDILQSDSRPTAMFVASDQEAIRVMRLLKENGVEIPDDVSIVGYDDLDFAAHTSPSLTTISQPMYDIGKEACRMLITMMNDEVKRVSTTLVLKSTNLRIRDSTRKLTQ